VVDATSLDVQTVDVTSLDVQMRREVRWWWMRHRWIFKRAGGSGRCNAVGHLTAQAGEVGVYATSLDVQMRRGRYQSLSNVYGAFRQQSECGCPVHQPYRIPTSAQGGSGIKTDLLIMTRSDNSRNAVIVDGMLASTTSQMSV
jgi:hypothetical protein